MSQYRHPRAIHAAVLLLCLAGAALSGLLVMQGIEARTGASGVAGWICRVVSHDEGGCAATARSGWARINVPIPFTTRRPAIPVALLGFAYFVSLGVWFASIGVAVGRWPRRLLLAVTAAGLAGSLVLSGLMISAAVSWCVLCAIVHGVNLLLVALVWHAVRRAPDPPQDAAGVTARHALTAAALAMAIVAVAWTFRHERVERRVRAERLEPYRALVTSLRRDPDFLRREHAARPQHDFPLRSTELPAENRAELVMFTDFECPACLCRARYVQDQVMPMFDNGLVVRIRHFPAPRAGSQAAARATEAARVLGGEAAFDAARTAIVAEGWDAFADDGARVLAERLGLDPGSFARAMHGDEVDVIVRADVALGESLGLSATPTLFLDGRRVDEIIDGPVFWQAAAGDAP